jgi:hypothetical protein
MKNLIYLFIFASFIISCKTKMVYNQVKFDEKSNSDILYGYTKLEAFQTVPYDSWYNFERGEYQIDTVTIAKIKSLNLNHIGITIVMATWCSDSQQEIPWFVKILESIGYDLNKLKIINVDRQKFAEGTTVNKLKIEKVPNIIFYKDKKELGRIIESPTESLEKDMLKILEH